MPVTEGIIVPITADAKGLTDGMDKAKKSIFSLKLEQEKYESMAFTEKNTLRLIEYNRKIQQLQTEVKQLSNIGKEGFDKMGNAVSGGNNALSKGFGLIRQIAYILPGVGIAGIIGFATEPLIKYIGSLTGISEAAKLAKKEQEDFNKALDKSAGSAIKMGFELQAYIAIAKDTTRSMQERNTALAEANKLYGEHNQQLTLTNIETEKVKEQVEGYTQALIANAIAAKYGDRLAEGYAKQREAARQYGEELAKLKSLEAGYREGLKQNGGLDISEGGATQNSAVRAYEVQLTKVTAATTKYKDATKALKLETGDYVEVLKKANELQSKYGEIEKPKKSVQKAEKELIEPNTKFQPEKLKGRFLGGAYDRVQMQTVLQYLNAINFATKQVGQTITEESNREANAMLKAQSAALAWRDTLYSIGDVIVPQLQNSFSSMFETLITGGSNAFGSLMQSLGRLVTKLISAAIAAAALAAILASTGLGAGLGFKGGFKDVFKSLFSGATGLKLASGGITNGPTRALIGEGKEREVVTPLSQLKNIIGNVGGSRDMPVPQLYMRGADMWIMWQRQQQQNLRSY